MLTIWFKSYAFSSDYVAQTLQKYCQVRGGSSKSSIFFWKIQRSSSGAFCVVRATYVKIEITIRDYSKLTFLGWLWTMSTASWLLRWSHRPSEANITNWSLELSLWTDIDGSALRIGSEKGSGNLNLANNGAWLNSDFLRYASPMDLETYIMTIY